MLSTAPQGGGGGNCRPALLQFVMASMLSLLQLVNASPGNRLSHPSPWPGASSAQTSAPTRGRRGMTSTLTLLALPHSPLPTCTSCRVGPPRALPKTKDKQTRYAVLLSCQQPPVAFQAFSFETFGGLHADALALLQRLQGLLNQAIIAQEDVEGYFVMHRVSFIIAAAVGRQLAARWV
eukprot:jgi/Botrbrau1/6085/Bobra.177_1s0023.1